MPATLGAPAIMAWAFDGAAGVAGELLACRSGAIVAEQRPLRIAGETAPVELRVQVVFEVWWQGISWTLPPFS